MLETLMIAQLVKKFSAFYGPRSFITAIGPYPDFSGPCFGIISFEPAGFVIREMFRLDYNIKVDPVDVMNRFKMAQYRALVQLPEICLGGRDNAGMNRRWDVNHNYAYRLRFVRYYPC
jgi:hypothetical protein